MKYSNAHTSSQISQMPTPNQVVKEEPYAGKIDNDDCVYFIGMYKHDSPEQNLSSLKLSPQNLLESDDNLRFESSTEQ